MSAIEDVQKRLLRATQALELAKIPYAVVGGNAVANWVSRVEKAAVRFTQNVDILLRRTERESAKSALVSADFVYRHSAGLDIFLDGPQGSFREGVHILFANEKVRPADSLVNPDVLESEQGENYRVISLEPLVRIKLSVFRDKDRMHLRDLIDVGLVDQSWTSRYPAELAARLQLLLDTPEG